MEFEIRYVMNDEIQERIFNITASHEDDLSKILNSAKKHLNHIFGEKTYTLLRVKSFHVENYSKPLPKYILDKYYKNEDSVKTTKIIGKKSASKKAVVKQSPSPKKSSSKSNPLPRKSSKRKR